MTFSSLPPCKSTRPDDLRGAPAPHTRLGWSASLTKGQLPHCRGTAEGPLSVKRAALPLPVKSSCCSPGGAEGTRTPDPHTASVVRYQLRHSPLVRAGLGRPRLDRTRARPCDWPREPQREEPRECDQRQPKI